MQSRVGWPSDQGACICMLGAVELSTCLLTGLLQRVRAHEGMIAGS